MIIFYNPQVDDFLAEPPHFRLFKRRALKKYGYLIDGTFASTGELRIFVDGTISAFIPDRIFLLLPRFLRQWISVWEVNRWIKINKFEGKVTLVSGPSDSGDDVLFGFSYKATTGSFKVRLPYLERFSIKIFHLSHYFISTKEKSDNLKQLHNVWLGGDSDIKTNRYFLHFFNWYQRPIKVIPFSVADRFQVRRCFREREPLCVATGTFHNLYEEIPTEKYQDYVNFFHISTYHPVRKLIYEHAADISNYIVSKISLYRAKMKKGRILRFLKHFSVAQKAYFSIDIIELYNNYQYAIVGEEAVGFPALGAFEAMACGCVLIAEPKFYTGLGLKAGKHFVPHDGNLDSIVECIKMLNTNTDMAEKIAEAGSNFVNLHFRQKQAFSRFLNTMTKNNLMIL